MITPTNPIHGWLTMMTRRDTPCFFLIFNGWLTGGLNVWWWTIYDNMMGCSARDHIGSSSSGCDGIIMMDDDGCWGDHGLAVLGLLDCNPTCRYSSWLGQAVDPFCLKSTGNKQSKWNASTKNQHSTPIKLPRTWLADPDPPAPGPPAGWVAGESLERAAQKALLHCTWCGAHCQGLAVDWAVFMLFLGGSSSGSMSFPLLTGPGAVGQEP